MKRTAQILCLVVYSLLISANCDKDINSGGDEVSMERENRLEWFKEAKFGMFIHWGPYSHLAGEWKGRPMPVGEIAEWIMHYYKIPVEEYRKKAAEFNPVKFDARTWVALAKNTGMKYLVITAKHHDGFAMYDSEVSDYDIVDYTEFGRDPMRELSEECAKQGIRFCFYYSHREDWDHPDAYGNDWDYNPAEQNFDRYLREKSKPQLRELLTSYGPLGLIWFDRGIYTQEQAAEFVSIVREIQPQCLVNGRVGNYEQELMGDYQNMSDNGMPVGGIEEYWETPQTLNETWGFSKFDTTWKSPEEVIRRLVEITSKGGNYLLNVGPTGEGVIPAASVSILEKVGEWMKLNGESIYGVSPGPFAEIPWGRCTVKNNKLYLHILEYPAGGVLQLEGLHNKIRNAYFLADPGQMLSVTREGNSARIAVQEGARPGMIPVIVMEIEGEPVVDPPVVIQNEDGSINLGCVEAVTDGRAVKRYNRKGDFHISKWRGPEDSIAWNANISQSGIFRVEITYAANPEWAGREFVVEAGTNVLNSAVQHTGDWYEYKTFELGTITLGTAGMHRVITRPFSASDQYLMYFRSMRLVRQ